jgi:hypothetical protein
MVKKFFSYNFDPHLLVVKKIWMSASSIAKFAAKISPAKILLAPTSALACLTSPATLASCSAMRQINAKVQNSLTFLFYSKTAQC